MAGSMYAFVFLLFASIWICDGDKRLLLPGNDGTQSLDSQIQSLRAELHQHVANTQAENMKLKAQIASLQQNAANSITTYVIWGRKDCPHLNGTTLIYTGITAGKHWNEKGSGVTTLCLPHDPEHTPPGFPNSVHRDLQSKIWGSEYQFTWRNIAIDDDSPCAVCQVQAYSTLLVPAKRHCPLGWRKEYVGVLASTYTGEYATDYLCIDENPEYFEGTHSQDLNGRTLYPVSASCGSLPCPPYVNNQYIACVLCSQ